MEIVVFGEQPQFRELEAEIMQAEVFDGYSMEFNRIVTAKYLDCFRTAQVRQPDVIKAVFLACLMLCRVETAAEIKQLILKFLQVEQNADVAQKIIDNVDLIRYCLACGADG